jgi:hypothetical protein
LFEGRRNEKVKDKGDRNAVRKREERMRYKRNKEEEVINDSRSRLRGNVIVVSSYHF